MSEAVATEFWQGVEQFNQGEYYACHDTLEAIWIEASDPQKTFYQGILQVAVALYHLGNQNLRGATILLGEGINRLRRYQPDFAEIDVADLVNQCVNLLVVLQHATPDQVPLLAALVQSNHSAADADRLTLPLQLPVIAKVCS
ncbi:DUF309 domain-containing protein [Thermocoleostomius sinensis]|jgi:predicted metal-dependent hydrolase|uniref:DUF309 domain-containing protein n=1 Tax=Thermocoleostomius sinensis A174 TaxID=2016057 RepID=A0A9E8ZFV4_9CYAN|nr:DUF309 domain-containing protein [Thermocoleostomius sinensis]WAL60593.1 DUF309 domain-containing protein [Thermocoleostomius sinensis A174]